MTSFDPSRDCAGHYVLFKAVHEPSWTWYYRGWQLCWGCYCILFGWEDLGEVAGHTLNKGLTALNKSLSGWYTTGVGADFIR